MVLGIIMGIFALAGLSVDGWHGSKAFRDGIKADRAGVRAEFLAASKASWGLYPCVGICKKTVENPATVILERSERVVEPGWIIK
jgi:hypothetical protein